MSSARLPGKMLKMLGNMTLIDRVYSNLKKTEGVSKIIVATSEDDTDLPLVNHCYKNKINCYRGSLKDVASRYLQIAQAEHEAAFVRISGDSPIIDSELVGQLIREYKEGCFDLVTNVHERTYPKGQSVEVFSTKMFTESYPLFNTPDHFEHVSSYYYENTDAFNIKNIRSGGYYNDINLSIDTPEDYKRLEILALECGESLSSWRDSANKYSELFINV